MLQKQVTVMHRSGDLRKHCIEAKKLHPSGVRIDNSRGPLRESRSGL